MLSSAREKLTLRIDGLLPGAQRAVVEERKKRVVCSCSRRSGKTHVLTERAMWAVLDTPWADQNKSRPVVQIIGLTRQTAHQLFWEKLKYVARQIGLEAHWNDHESYAEFPNGVLLRLGGADSVDEIEKYRGFSYSFVGIDESASYGPKMENLVMDAITMALGDYDGSLVLIGSPGKVKTGLFYERCMRPPEDWTIYKWNYFENIHVPAQMRTNQWVIENIGPLQSPRAQREAFGQWVADDSSLVYHFNDLADNFHTGPLPEGHNWRYILGMDLGYRDPTAFEVIAYAPTSPYMYEVYSYAEQHMLPEMIVQRIHEIKKAFPINQIVADNAGATTQGLFDEWNKRHGFGIQPTNKRLKFEYIEHLNSEFYKNKIKMLHTSNAVKEMAALIYYEDSDGRHDQKQKEHPGFPNHNCDAFLYAFRLSMHFKGRETSIKPTLSYNEHLIIAEKAAKLKALKDQRTKQLRKARGFNGRRF
jgi:hypothetical protein